MDLHDLSRNNLSHIKDEIDYDINLLYVCRSVSTRHMILDHLRDRINVLESVMEMMDQPLQNQYQTMYPLLEQQLTEKQLIPLESSTSDNLNNYTLQELSTFHGKDGKAAYVAIDGIVYDVTNSAAWGAATHFGLSAGKDLTKEFKACHAGQSILHKLNAVGRLV